MVRPDPRNAAFRATRREFVRKEAERNALLAKHGTRYKRDCPVCRGEMGRACDTGPVLCGGDGDVGHLVAVLEVPNFWITA